MRNEKGILRIRDHELHLFLLHILPAAFHAQEQKGRSRGERNLSIKEKVS